MLPSGVRCLPRVAAAVGWLMLLSAAVTPWDPSLDVSTLMLAMAGVGSIVSAICHRSHPVSQVLEAGRSIGRAEALMECGSDDVIRLAERPHLRVVDGD